MKKLSIREVYTVVKFMDYGK